MKNEQYFVNVILEGFQIIRKLGIVYISSFLCLLKKFYLIFV